MKLEKKVAIITGAGRGLGQGIAYCFAEEGADLVLCSRSFTEVEKTAEKIKSMGRSALPVQTDVTQSQEVQQLVQDTLNTFGRIDILVNNVGGGRSDVGVGGGAVSKRGFSILDLSDDDWDGSYEVNLKSQVYMCKAVASHMKAQKSGKIINISSIAGKTGDPYRMPYSAMKAATINFTRALAKELARDNINVNCICPGLIYTPAWQVGAKILLEKAPAYQTLKAPENVFQEYVKRLVPLGREQTAEDIGRTAVFLASDDARNITGQAINVDGGIVMD
ncbi:MAG: SDR family oxidoreductase [Dehalococcoidia bacterium]|nr:SDR family oxidoreductase [Dehalococcoidia bacterium]